MDIVMSVRNLQDMELGKSLLPGAETTREQSSHEILASSELWCFFLLGIQLRNNTGAMGWISRQKNQPPSSPRVQVQKGLILDYYVPKI